MKILWVTSQELPIISKDLGTPVSGFGGWVTNMLNVLKSEKNLKLGIAMVSSRVDKLWMKEIDSMCCFVAPDSGQKSISDKLRDEIIDRFNPDIIHIEGNEFQIQNSFTKTSIKTLLSLQGILMGYEPYQYGCMPIADYMYNLKCKKMIASWVLFFRKHLRFNKRIGVEIESIQNVKFISGRTFWDKAYSYWLNPGAKYFPCNRILRPAFYKEKWCVDVMKPHSIFVGNGYSPLKGLHFVLEAVALLKKEFPDVTLNVAGLSPIYSGSVFHPQRYGYSSIIKWIIKNKNIEKNVHFLGRILSVKMIQTMKGSNVYLLPSLIENSPNTLGEAMLLGMPCVSAYIGGAPEMAIDEKECLFYRANDPYLLAWQIRRIFNDTHLAVQLGRKAREHAIITHDPQKNKEALVCAYNAILKEVK